jgi:tetratricopeptide (TPR) repeat protein
MTSRLLPIALLALTAGPALAQEAAPRGAAERDRLLALAASELAAGRRPEAARLYAEVADRFQSARALLDLARLQAADGDRPAALASLARARALAPSSEEVLSTLAQASLAAGAVAPAALVLRDLTRMCAGVAQYHHLHGVALMLVGDMAAAQEALEQAERLEPNKAETLVALGLTLNDRKRYADAKPYLARGLELEPDNLDALAALADAEQGLGELDRAETLARRVLAKAGGHANANLVLGLVLMNRERYEEARDAFLRALASQPGLPKAHYQASLAYARLGDAVNAEQQLARYQQAQRDMEERLNRLRTASGSGSGAR